MAARPAGYRRWADGVTPFYTFALERIPWLKRDVFALAYHRKQRDRRRLLPSSSARRPLIERDADSVFSAPHETTTKARAVCDKIEVVGDADWARYVELRARIRSISNHAREGAAAELNRSGFQNTTARCPTLLHGNRTLGLETF
jgi:hypothetical protein